MALSALGGQDVAIADRDLVGLGQDRLVEEDIGDLDAESVATTDVLGLGIWVAVEEGLGADFPEGLVEMAALCEDLVEGVDVRVDGGGQGRVGGAVGGRVLEELLATGGVEARGPGGAGGRRRHGEAAGLLARLLAMGYGQQRGGCQVNQSLSQSGARRLCHGPSAVVCAAVDEYLTKRVDAVHGSRKKVQRSHRPPPPQR